MILEAEVLPGLKPFLRQEIAQGRHVQEIDTGREDQFTFRYDEGQPADFAHLRTAVAVYHVLHLPIPRPKALLGHQHFTAVTRAIHSIRSANPSGAFSTMKVSAAGRDSSVLQRFRRELSEAVHLDDVEGEGDLVIRLRPAQTQPTGWEVLLRTTPRPLGTREWRVRDMPGALHATAAAAMVMLARPTDRDRYLNLMCGSGTLLIERLALHPVRLSVGLEIDDEVLDLARENIAAAGVTERIALIQGDAARTPLPAATFDVLTADFPWGQLVGSQAEIEALYPAALTEAARIAKPGARFVVITHAVTLFEATLTAETAWQLKRKISIFQGGLHPRIYLLERTP